MQVTLDVVGVVGFEREIMSLFEQDDDSHMRFPLFCGSTSASAEILQQFALIKKTDFMPYKFRACT
jgi:hypothetical protein